eukprot:TRINITY_DN6467_c0_g1_i1.p1 TRINITY_DN6467_c0_g1~~TRINITY_DN6467_c0_g1_i1.p1  ORF type:complete len:334 (-),score=53.09 TRINITY_DN6467_c0_g1_i1:75-1076(-)
MLLQLDTDTEVNRDHDFDRVRATFSVHWPEAKLADINHIGSCDNDIYLVSLVDPVVASTKNISRVAIRYPVLSISERPHQHNSEHQAWVSRQWEKCGVPVPVVLKVSNEHDFLIEEAIDGKELALFPNEVVNKLWPKVGEYLKDMHQVKTSLFGHFSSSPGVGTKNTWLDFIDELFLARLNVIHTEGVWQDDFYNRILSVYNKHKNYLLNFSDPGLIHGDINQTNVFAVEDGAEVRVSGIIDFSDCISGDQLYDLGGLLIEASVKEDPQWENIEMVLKGYGPLTPHQEELVKFYALVVTVYYLCEDMEVRKKRIPKYTRKAEVLLSWMNRVRT